MEVNIHKSSILFNGLEENLEKQFFQAFDKGLEYIGFYLKLNDYKFKDWNCLCEKI